ncbi:MerC domain-containing protein [Litoribacter ruber]|uniref:MerC domain-containing protein n=1 Tax=Litoribacter ruber TaxID=702568 RepID=A0AAP2G4X4_9BACT|nr:MULTISPECIES: MerC domain-containing protein [Litoribacter]MBS9524945.1 MerC domain-containing protein [Litoribacter alkaliphilus]MBT0811894.1 MerC domain-containing protein [Litoribacter ruber]
MLQKVKEIALLKSDILGMSASFVCMIHCISAPVIISMGYFFNFYTHNHTFDFVFFLLALVAVWLTNKSTQSVLIKVALWATVCLFGTSLFLHDFIQWMQYVSLVCSAILVSIHYLNWKYQFK